MKQSEHFRPEQYTEWFIATTSKPSSPGWYECTGWRFSGYLHLYWCGKQWHYFGPPNADPKFPAFGQHITDAWRGLITQNIPRRKTVYTDLTGKRFGMLTGLQMEYATRRGAFWMFQCDCGNKRIAQSKWVISGNTASCGCHRGKKKVIPVSRPWDRKPLRRGITTSSTSN